MRLSLLGCSLGGAPVGGLLGLLIWGMVHPTPRPDPMLGRLAPPLAIQSNDGPAVDLASLRGSPIVLNFWASWCVPARRPLT